MRNDATAMWPNGVRGRATASEDLVVANLTLRDFYFHLRL
jgi:hypothetical protein